MLVYSHYSDERLLELLNCDDEVAFYALYEKYHHAVFLNVMRTIRNPAEAEDILQELFCRLWQKRHTLGSDRSIGGWLFMVSYHLTVDHIRTKLKQEKALKYYYTQEDEEDLVNTDEMYFTVMEEALQKLSPQKRKVFELCKLQGKSYEKAAAELGISRNTVSDYLKEAMVSIRSYAQRSATTYPAISAVTLSLFLQ